MWLETNGLNKRFDGVVALDDVSVEFPAGSVTAVLGPNGAGKTTLFSVIMGFQSPDSGSVVLGESGAGTERSSVETSTNIAGLAPHEIARKGVGVLFQDVRVFKGLSALENVAVGFRKQSGERALNCLLHPAKVRRDEADVLERGRGYLAYVGLAEIANTWASQLSYGQQKLVAIARLLASDARLLLLDEPTAGVDPGMVDKLLNLVQRLANEDGRAVVMIEHNLNVVRRVGDWVYLMDRGRVEVFGQPSEVLRDRTLQQIFPTL